MLLGMPRKKPEQSALFEPPQADLGTPKQRPTRELWRFVRFYCQNIRAQSAEDCKGVIRAIQRMVDKGIGLEDIAQALENYAEDPWRKQQDPRYSKPIRAFFKPEVIREWLTPKPPPKPVQPVFDFEPTIRPVPAVPIADSDENSDL